MPIKVRGYLTFRDIIGERSIAITDGEILTVNDLLIRLSQELDQRFRGTIYDPQTKILGEYVAVIINGRSYHNLPDKLQSQLIEGDEVAIFPPMAGG